MTQAADIRAWLATQGTQVVDGMLVAGCTAAEIAAATGLEPKSVAMALGYMKTAGMVIGDGKRPQRYALVAGPKRVHARPEAERVAMRRQWCKNYKTRRAATETSAQRDARMAKERAQCAAKRQRLGKRTLAQYRAEQAAARQAKPIQAKPAPKPKPIEQAIATVQRMKAAKVQPVVRTPKPTQAPVVRQIAPAQTVEEWMASGGVIERLHPGACRDPLRVIGVAL